MNAPIDVRAMLGLGPSHTETARVVQLPRKPEGRTTPDLTDEFLVPGTTRRWRTHDGIEVTGLRPVQSEMLAELRDMRGLVGAVGVGHGKALVALLAATALGSRVAIVLTRARLLQQLRATYYEWRLHYRMLPPAAMKILSYEELSQPKGTALLEALIGSVPEQDCVVVCDEAHMLKRRDSARTKRLLRFFAERNIPFVALSGTLTSSKIDQCLHLCELALRENSPMPREAGPLSHGEAWSQCLDAEGRPNEHHWRLISPLLATFGGPGDQGLVGQDRIDAARRAFARRFASARGVVTTTGSAVASGLNLYAIHDVVVPPEVQSLIDRAERGEDPDGEPLADDMAAWRVARHLSLGFHYRWAWPMGCRACKGSGFDALTAPCSVRAQGHLIGRLVDEEWLTARRLWAKVVRKELKDAAREDYDSEFLVMQACRRRYEAGERSGHLLAAYEQWMGQAHKRWDGQPRPPTSTVRLSGFAIDHALSTIRGIDKPTLVWYSSQGTAQALHENGLKVYGGGEQPDTRKIETCAVSVHAHREGLDLQWWAHNVVLEPPSSGDAWEQMLGRTHRPGQRADEVEVFVYQHTKVLKQAVETARRQARYAETTTGNQQKLNIATLVGW